MLTPQQIASLRVKLDLETMKAATAGRDYTPVRFIFDMSTRKYALLYAYKQGDLFDGLSCLQYWKRR
jgi:hypothetical protein